APQPSHKFGTSLTRMLSAAPLEPLRPSSELRAPGAYRCKPGPNLHRTWFARSNAALGVALGLSRFRSATSRPATRRAPAGRILVTGGCGYIGSHTVLALLQENYEVLVLDNLSRADSRSLCRVQQLAASEQLPTEEVRKRLVLRKADLCNEDEILAALRFETFDAVIHLAGYKSVGESVRFPLLYWKNNVEGFRKLLSFLRAHQASSRVLLSSSCTVYQPSLSKMTEDAVLEPTCPYGKTKLAQEEILKDQIASDSTWSACALRYFNPAGAHSSSQLGEVPVESSPHMLVPLIQQVALGKRPELSVFGTDYNTVDGTAVRDYLHIQDVAEAHVAALQHLQSGSFQAFNLGTGKGSTVLEVVTAFQRSSGLDVPCSFQDRRAGDAPFAVANPSRAEAVLGWRAKRGLGEIVASAWSFARQNPEGFQGAPFRNSTPWQTPTSHHVEHLERQIRAASALVGPFEGLGLLEHESAQSAQSVKYVVDLGGTNLRVFRFCGSQDCYTGSEVVVPNHLKSEDASAGELFDFIASVVAKVFHQHPGDANAMAPLPLCLIFSFALDSGRLKHWAKDWATRGVVAADLSELMNVALRWQNLPLEVHHVLNDCVSSLFALPTVADVAVVVGTGTNACFVESKDELRIFSTEWASLTTGLPIRQEDLVTHAPDAVNLERLVSGLYLPRTVKTFCPHSGRLTMRELVEACCSEQPSALQEASQFVVSRSAAVCAKALAAALTIVAETRPEHETLQVVLDGALLHVPRYLATLKMCLADGLPLRLHRRVKLHLIQNAASLGATRFLNSTNQQ
ncbi:unnamed protein product, partial [Effrenium voratum]